MEGFGLYLWDSSRIPREPGGYARHAQKELLLALAEAVGKIGG